MSLTVVTWAQSKETSLSNSAQPSYGGEIIKSLDVEKMSLPDSRISGQGHIDIGQVERYKLALLTS